MWPEYKPGLREQAELPNRRSNRRNEKIKKIAGAQEDLTFTLKTFQGVFPFLITIFPLSSYSSALGAFLELTV